MASFLVVTATALTPLFHIQARAQAILTQEKVSFHISAGSLQDALVAFSTQSHIPVTSEASSLAGHVTSGLSGVFTPADALGRLLQGSGLSYSPAGDHAYQIVAGLSAITLGPVRVEGQDRSAGVRSALGRAAAPGLERVLVSGTKMPIALGENPQSVSTVDRVQMDLQAVQSVPEALRYLPGVTAEIGGDDNRIETGQIFVRGFNPGEYLDGLRLQAGTWATPQFDAYALQSIDVVKGPDSVVYGQASPGGIVTMTSKTPTDAPLHEVKLTGGSWGRFQAGVDISDRLNSSGSVTYRLVGLFRNTGTQVDHTTLRRFLLAPSLKWQIDPATSLTFLVSYQADPEGGFYNQLPYYGTLLKDPHGQIATSAYLGEPDYDRMRRNQLSIGYEFRHQFQPWLTFRQNFRYQFVDANYNAITFDAIQADLQSVSRDTYQARENLNTIALDNQLQADYHTAP